MTLEEEIVSMELTTALEGAKSVEEVLERLELSEAHAEISEMYPVDVYGPTTAEQAGEWKEAIAKSTSVEEVLKRTGMWDAHLRILKAHRRYALVMAEFIRRNLAKAAN
jgi:hypothetical protein